MVLACAALQSLPTKLGLLSFESSRLSTAGPDAKKIQKKTTQKLKPTDIVNLEKRLPFTVIVDFSQSAPGLLCMSGMPQLRKKDAADNGTHIHPHIHACTCAQSHNTGMQERRERGMVITSCVSRMRDLTIHSCILLISMNIHREPSPVEPCSSTLQALSGIQNPLTQVGRSKKPNKTETKQKQNPQTTNPGINLRISKHFHKHLI